MLNLKLFINPDNINPIKLKPHTVRTLMRSGLFFDLGYNEDNVWTNYDDVCEVETPLSFYKGGEEDIIGFYLQDILNIIHRQLTDDDGLLNPEVLILTPIGDITHFKRVNHSRDEVYWARCVTRSDGDLDVFYNVFGKATLVKTVEGKSVIQSNEMFDIKDVIIR